MVAFRFSNTRSDSRKRRSARTARRSTALTRGRPRVGFLRSRATRSNRRRPASFPSHRHRLPCRRWDSPRSRTVDALIFAVRAPASRVLAGVSFSPIAPDGVAGLGQAFLVAAKLLQGFTREELCGVARGMAQRLEAACVAFNRAGGSSQLRNSACAEFIAS